MSSLTVSEHLGGGLVANRCRDGNSRTLTMFGNDYFGIGTEASRLVPLNAEVVKNKRRYAAMFSRPGINLRSELVVYASSSRK